MLTSPATCCFLHYFIHGLTMSSLRSRVYPRKRKNSGLTLESSYELETALKTEYSLVEELAHCTSTTRASSFLLVLCERDAVDENDTVKGYFLVCSMYLLGIVKEIKEEKM